MTARPAPAARRPGKARKKPAEAIELPVVYYGRGYIAAQLGVAGADTVAVIAARAQDTGRPFPPPDIVIKSRHPDETIDFGTDSRGRSIHGHDVPGWSKESLKAVKAWFRDRRGEPAATAEGAEGEPKELPCFYGSGAVARKLGKDKTIVAVWTRRYAGTNHPFPKPDVAIKGSGEINTDLLYYGWSEKALADTIPGWEAGRPDAIANRRERAEPATATPKDRIRSAYQKLATGRLAWVRLADLRELDEFPREEQDKALRAMSKLHQAVLAPAPEPDAADDAAALEIRGVPNHLIVVV